MLFISLRQPRFYQCRAIIDIRRKGSPWQGYVKTAVRRVRKKGDHHIYTLIIPYRQTPGHPHVTEQEMMSKMLDKKISEIRK